MITYGGITLVLPVQFVKGVLLLDSFVARGKIFTILIAIGSQNIFVLIVKHRYLKYTLRPMIRYIIINY